MQIEFMNFKIKVYIGSRPFNIIIYLIKHTKMPGACDCEDEQVKDMKCCGCLPSYCWFKVMAWFQVVGSIIIMIPLLLGVLFMGAVTAGAAGADGATVTDE